MARDNKRPVPEAWRTYIELAMGVTEASRKKAGKVAKELLGKTNATADQVQTLAEELLSASLTNREAMAKLVRFELDRALGLVGLATAEEVSDLTKRVKELELREAKVVTGELNPAVLTDSRNGQDIGAVSTSAPSKKTAKKAMKKAASAKAAAEPAMAPAKKTAKKAAKKAAGGG